MKTAFASQPSVNEVDRERSSTVSRGHRSLGIKAASSRATQASRSEGARVRTYILSFVGLSVADRVLFRSGDPIFICMPVSLV